MANKVPIGKKKYYMVFFTEELLAKVPDHPVPGYQLPEELRLPFLERKERAVVESPIPSDESSDEAESPRVKPKAKPKTAPAANLNKLTERAKSRKKKGIPETKTSPPVFTPDTPHEKGKPRKKKEKAEPMIAPDIPLNKPKKSAQRPTHKVKWRAVQKLVTSLDGFNTRAKHSKKKGKAKKIRGLAVPLYPPHKSARSKKKGKGKSTRGPAIHLDEPNEKAKSPKEKAKPGSKLPKVATFNSPNERAESPKKKGKAKAIPLDELNARAESPQPRRRVRAIRAPAIPLSQLNKITELPKEEEPNNDLYVMFWNELLEAARQRKK